MDILTNRDLRIHWRRRLFRIWILATAAVAIYIGLGEPLTNYFGDGRTYIAIASTALMFFLLVTGFGWLVLFVLAGPPRHRTFCKTSGVSPNPVADYHRVISSTWQQQTLSPSSKNRDGPQNPGGSSGDNRNRSCHFRPVKCISGGDFRWISSMTM